MILFFLLIVFPFLELMGIWRVGQSVGFWQTLFYLIAGVFVGVWTTRLQGQLIFAQMQSEMAAGKVPADQVLRGVLVFFAGILFIVPGFISDAVALLLLFPPTRWALSFVVRKWLSAAVQKGQMRFYSKSWSASGQSHTNGSPHIVDVSSESLMDDDKSDQKLI